MSESHRAKSEEEYEQDPRTACKYGSGCYQKNPQHHRRFKHPPPSPKRSRQDSSDSEAEAAVSEAKRAKTSDSNGAQSDHSPTHNTNGTPAQDNTRDTTQDTTQDTNDGAAQDTNDNEDHDSTQGSTEATEDSNGPGEAACWDVPVTSPQDPREHIQAKFLIEMPDDFFHLWDLCKSMNKEKPEEALSAAGLTLVGPYDVLSGKLAALTTRTLGQYLCHWRYYHDLPEFTTVIAGSEDEFHMGYYRDDCSSRPVLVAAASARRPGTLATLGDNVLAAVCNHLAEKIKNANPFNKTKLQKLMKELENFAKEKNHSLEVKPASLKARAKKVVAKCFHGAGIVVPFVNDVGYRELPDPDKVIKNLLKKLVEAKTEEEKLRNFDPIQELLTNVQFGMDEGDFGMGLEFGHDLFVYGGEVLHKTVRHVLGVAYDLLDRPHFNTILQAHLRNRRKGANMSILDAE